MYADSELIDLSWEKPNALADLVSADQTPRIPGMTSSVYSRATNGGEILTHQSVPSKRPTSSMYSRPTDYTDALPASADLDQHGVGDIVTVGGEMFKVIEIVECDCEGPCELQHEPKVMKISHDVKSKSRVPKAASSLGRIAEDKATIFPHERRPAGSKNKAGIVASGTPAIVAAGISESVIAGPVAAYSAVFVPLPSSSVRPKSVAASISEYSTSAGSSTSTSVWSSSRSDASSESVFRATTIEYKVAPLHRVVLVPSPSSSKRVISNVASVSECSTSTNSTTSSPAAYNDLLDFLNDWTQQYGISMTDMSPIKLSPTMSAAEFRRSVAASVFSDFAFGDTEVVVPADHEHHEAYGELMEKLDALSKANGLHDVNVPSLAATLDGSRTPAPVIDWAAPRDTANLGVRFDRLSLYSRSPSPEDH